MIIAVVYMSYNMVAKLGTFLSKQNIHKCIKFKNYYFIGKRFNLQLV